jgi:hypothetical protein
MLAGGIIAQTTHIPLCTHASLFEGGEQGIKTWTYTSICICFPPKISSVVVVAFQCSGSYLQEHKMFFCESCSMLQILTCSHCDKTCMTRLEKFVEFFGGSKTLSGWAK